MAPLDQLLHLLNLLYPAMGLGLLLALLGQVFVRNRPSAPEFIAQIAINIVAGSVALMAGLWLLGRDGKMATYCLLVLACACSQCWLRWGARRSKAR